VRPTSRREYPHPPNPAAARKSVSASPGWRAYFCFSLLATVILLADATGCSYLQGTPPNGKISVQVVSWKLVKKLAEPDAGLKGRKVTILNPADRSVVATGTTDGSGVIEFDLPPGSYILVGASDEPQSVQVMTRKSRALVDGESHEHR
jgi:hypothetical protein